jgi:hypothetical protein
MHINAGLERQLPLLGAVALMRQRSMLPLSNDE